MFIIKRKAYDFDIMRIQCVAKKIFLYSIFLLLIVFQYIYISQRHILRFDEIRSIAEPFKPRNKSMLLHINGQIKIIGRIKQIYIVNLAYRLDRRTNLIALMQRLNLDAFISPAYTIRSLPVISRIALIYHGKITLVELACWASHMQLWTDISTEAPDNWSLIFEDDIDLELNTADILRSLPNDIWEKADLIYLGYCGDRPGQLIYETTYGYRIHRALNPSCTHAYAIKTNASLKLLNLLSMPKKAVDDEIVVLAQKRVIEVFSIHPPLALQKEITSSNPSDVNPTRDAFLYKWKSRISLIATWWNRVPIINKLQHSALDEANFERAEAWRKSNDRIPVQK